MIPRVRRRGLVRPSKISSVRKLGLMVNSWLKQSVLNSSIFDLHQGSRFVGIDGTEEVLCSSCMKLAEFLK